MGNVVKPAKIYRIFLLVVILFRFGDKFAAPAITWWLHSEVSGTKDDTGTMEIIKAVL